MEKGSERSGKQWVAENLHCTTLIRLCPQFCTHHCSSTHSHPADSLSHSCSRSCQWYWYTSVHNLHYWYHTHPHLNKRRHVELVILYCNTVFVNRNLWLMVRKYHRWSYTWPHNASTVFILQNGIHGHIHIRGWIRFMTNTYPGTWCSHLGSDHTEVAPVSTQKMSDTLAKRYHPECSPNDPRKLDHSLPAQWLSPHL